MDIKLYMTRILKLTSDDEILKLKFSYDRALGFEMTEEVTSCHNTFNGPTHHLSSYYFEFWFS